MVTKASAEPLLAEANAPGVVGKLVEQVSPVTYALPCPSTAIAVPMSPPLPARYVVYTIAEPVGFSFVTKMSASGLLQLPGLPDVEPVENVMPTTYAFPCPSTAIPLPSSQAVPPR